MLIYIFFTLKCICVDPEDKFNHYVFKYIEYNFST